MRKFVDALAFAALVLVGVFWAATAFAQITTNTGIPVGGTQIIGSASGTTAGATANLQPIGGTPGLQYAYLCGFIVSTGTATAAITVNTTSSGLPNNFSIFTNSPVTAATATAGPTISQTFSPCLRGLTPGSGVISISTSALGAGGVSQTVYAWGYSLPSN